MITNIEESRLFLKQQAGSDHVVDELLNYTKNKFSGGGHEFSTNDSPQIKAYQKYKMEAESEGAFNILQKNLVQLQFPVRDGISQTEEYKNATLRGRAKSGTRDLQLLNPDAITLEIYESSLIGKVPVITDPDDTDFATIICALSHRNEPKVIPQSMGAAFIRGINNWDRIKTIKKEFLEGNPDGDWKREFQEGILPNGELYKDQLIVLSAKPYSNVMPDVLGLDESTWKSHSLKIRRDHECAHLFTLKCYGVMSNNIHDEVVADYVGISSVSGIFSSSWFLHFMGLERFPHYRQGGRLQNYIGDLSSDAFRVLQLIVKRAAENISQFDQTLGVPENNLRRMNRVKSICERDLISMAMEGGTQYLLDTYEACFSLQV